MRKVLIYGLFFILIIFSLAYSETSSSSINWLSKNRADTIYCQINGDCTLNNLTVNHFTNLTYSIVEINATEIDGEYWLNETGDTWQGNFDTNGYNLTGLDYLSTNTLNVDLSATIAEGLFVGSDINTDNNVIAGQDIRAGDDLQCTDDAYIGDTAYIGSDDIMSITADSISSTASMDIYPETFLTIHGRTIIQSDFLSSNSGVYTDASKELTSTVPSELTFNDIKPKNVNSSGNITAKQVCDSDDGLCLHNVTDNYYTKPQVNDYILWENSSGYVKLKTSQGVSIKSNNGASVTDAKDINLTGGTGGTGASLVTAGAGSDIYISTGTGGLGYASPSFSNAGRGGDMWIKLGDGGFATAGKSSGNGGNFYLNSGNGEQSGGGTGGNGGNILMVAGWGGNSTGASGGAGGCVNITSGSGGQASGGVKDAGDINILSGTGQGTYGNGGRGGDMSMQSGDGGYTIYSTGGTGGNFYLGAGAGGEGQQGYGGIGGSAEFFGGAGGDGGTVSGVKWGGDGGSIYFYGGAGGVGGGGAVDGDDGNVILGTDSSGNTIGYVLIGRKTPFSNGNGTSILQIQGDLSINGSISEFSEKDKNYISNSRIDSMPLPEDAIDYNTGHLSNEALLDGEKIIETWTEYPYTIEVCYNEKEFRGCINETDYSRPVERSITKTSLSRTAFNNRLSLIELTAKIDHLETELCKKDNTYGFCK